MSNTLFLQSCYYYYYYYDCGFLLCGSRKPEEDRQHEKKTKWALALLLSRLHLLSPSLSLYRYCVLNFDMECAKSRWPLVPSTNRWCNLNIWDCKCQLSTVPRTCCATHNKYDKHSNGLDCHLIDYLHLRNVKLLEKFDRFKTTGKHTAAEMTLHRLLVCRNIHKILPSVTNTCIIRCLTNQIKCSALNDVLIFPSQIRQKHITTSVSAMP